MAEYIERKAAVKLLRGACVGKYPSTFYTGLFAAAGEIEKMPAADVVEVKHGRWVVENEESIRCSECCFNRASIKIPLDFCPHCGARMT